MIKMVMEQSFRLTDEGKKFTAKEWGMPFREDHEDFKATTEWRYKKSRDNYLPQIMAP
jgi:hypothetical protein